MRDILLKIADKLAEKNALILPKSGSVFEAIEVPGTTEADYLTLANAIAIKLGNEVSLIKNKIFPLLWSYSGMVKEIVSGIKDDNDLNKYTIREISMPTMVAELKDGKYLNPTRNVFEFPITMLSIPVPTIDTVSEFFKPKFNAGVNAYAKGIVEQYTAEGLLSIWEKYFVNISKSNDNIVSLSYSTMSKIEEVLLLLIAVSNMKDTRPAGVLMPEDSYVDVMLFFYQELLNHVSRALEKYNFDVKYENLIMDSTVSYQICVNKDVYEKFLKENGNPEAILGKMTEQSTVGADDTLKDILINSEAYTTTWNQKVKLARMAAIADTVNKYRTAYYLSVHRFYNEIMTKDLSEYAEMDPNVARKAFMDYIATKEQSDIIDSDYMAMEFFGHIVFGRTNFHRFQHYMLDYKKLIPDLTTDETASFAACDMIMDYLLSQVEITNS